MPDLILCSDRFNSCGSDNLSVHKSDDFNLICARRLLLQKPAFLFRIKAVFIRIGEQIVRFRVRLVEIFKHRAPVGRRAVSENGGFSVF